MSRRVRKLTKAQRRVLRQTIGQDVDVWPYELSPAAWGIYVKLWRRGYLTVRTSEFGMSDDLGFLDLTPKGVAALEAQRERKE